MSSWFLLCFVVALAIVAAAADDVDCSEPADWAEHDHEIKLFLNSSLVLTSKNNVRKEVRDAFDIGKDSHYRMWVQYLDDPELSLRATGWIHRQRVKEIEKGFQLVYKRRFDVDGSDVDAALEYACNNNGFDYKEEDYSGQIDIGLSKQTLSFSRKKYDDLSGYSSDELPDAKDARDLAVDHIAGKLEKEVPGAEAILEDAWVFGPVEVDRWIGMFGGERCYIEVWFIDGLEMPVVEVSLKTGSYKYALAQLAALQTFVDLHGWLDPAEISKTKLILHNYGPSHE